MRGAPVCLIAVVLTVPTGCASASKALPVRGRSVELVLREPARPDRIKGELLAVGADVLLVHGPQGVRSVPRTEIARVRVELHRLDGRKAGAWVVLGAVVTGAALAVACGSADGEDCGGVFALVGLGWGLIGVPSAIGLGRSSRLLVTSSELDTLRPYARLPQGLPEGLDPGQLVPAPGRK